MSNRPEGYTDAQWHQEATADSGTDHVRYSKQHVIVCEWCDCVVFAPTLGEAATRFMAHRNEMYDQYLDEGVAAGRFPDPRKHADRDRV